MTKLLLPTHTTYRESISAVTRTGWFHIRVIERKRIGSDRRRRDGCRGPVTCNGADREQGPVVIIAESGCRNKDRGIAASVGKSSALAVTLLYPFGVDLLLIAQRLPLLNGRDTPPFRAWIRHLQPAGRRTARIVPCSSRRGGDHRNRRAPSNLFTPLIEHTGIPGTLSKGTGLIDVSLRPTNSVDPNSLVSTFGTLRLLSPGSRCKEKKSPQKNP